MVAVAESKEPTLVAASLQTAAQVSRSLDVGLLLQVELMRGTAKGPYLVKLIGWQESQFLIAELPMTKGAPAEWRCGDKVIVRSVLNGKAMGFRTKVITGQSKPAPLLFLDFPERVEIQTLRRHPRVPATGTAEFTLLGTAQSASVLLQDLSASGCGGFLVKPDARIQSGQTVHISAKLLDVGEIADLVAHIRVLKDIEHSTGLRTFIGFEFEWTDQTRAFQEQVVRYINQMSVDEL